VDAGADRRISIPAAFCEKISWLLASEAKLCWLLMIVPGRFRILSDPAVEQDPKLGQVRSLLLDGPSEAVEATTHEASERAAVVGRLVPIILTGPNPSWRFVVPRHLLSGPQRQSFVFMFSLGHLELWLREVYVAAQKPPLDSVL
jgi:hypothetical protein